MRVAELLNGQVRNAGGDSSTMLSIRFYDVGLQISAGAGLCCRRQPGES